MSKATLDDLRRLAVAQTLFRPTTLKRALKELGFVQADPIRAPARAQDLTLRHRVEGYRAGDLERLYAKLGVEEDFFVNYGFVTPSVYALMHPRPDATVPAAGGRPWPALRRKRAKDLHDFVRARGAVHPREVDQHFGHGKVTNYWGGSSNATTQLLDALHYIGHLRIVRREGGVRIYTAVERRERLVDEAQVRARLDALADVALRIYAPLPARSLHFFLRRLRYAVPQWASELTGAIRRAKERLPHVTVDGTEWHLPVNHRPSRDMPADDAVRFLAPFDPIVQDRWRFELLWGWVYRFEAYTPVAKRKLGYYALPLLWRDRVIGWANLAVKEGALATSLGYVSGTAPREKVFARELDAEIARMKVFLDAR